MKFLPLKHFAEESGIPIATLLDHCEVGELRSIKVGVGKSRNHYRLPQEWWDEFIVQQEQAAKKPRDSYPPLTRDEIELTNLRLARHLKGYIPRGSGRAKCKR